MTCRIFVANILKSIGIGRETMRFNHLHSDDLPNIDMSIKKCINSGQWFLFKAPSEAGDGCSCLFSVRTLKAPHYDSPTVHADVALIVLTRVVL